MPGVKQESTPKTFFFNYIKRYSELKRKITSKEEYEFKLDSDHYFTLDLKRERNIKPKFEDDILRDF